MTCIATFTDEIVTCLLAVDGVLSLGEALLEAFGLLEDDEGEAPRLALKRVHYDKSSLADLDKDLGHFWSNLT